MQSAWREFLALTGSARRLRGALVLVTCAAIVGWGLLAATHFHDHEEDGAGGHAVATCLHCAAAPTGAAPPAQSFAPAFVPCSRTAPATVEAAAPALACVQAYLIRGPPLV